MSDVCWLRWRLAIAAGEEPMARAWAGYLREMPPPRWTEAQCLGFRAWCLSREMP